MGSSMAYMACLPFTLNVQSISGCTISVMYGALPNTMREDPMAIPGLSEKEVEELLSDF